MEEKKVYESIVNEGILHEFHSRMGQSLMNHAFNTCHIENYLSIVSVLVPRLVEVNGCIFIEEFYDGDYASLDQQFSGNKKKIERFVNTWSLGEFFLLSRDVSVDNDVIFNEFCKIVQHFWTQRVKTLFPERNIVVEIGWEFVGESGMAITMYQA